jgi:ParB family chromosome partitioning protein
MNHTEVMNITVLSLGELVEPAANARRKMDPAKLQDLARSILADGVLQNLLGKVREDGKVEVVAGARRLRASRLAVEMALERGLQELARARATVPVRILTTEEAAKAEILQLVENLQRESMSIRDEVDGLGRLVDAGMSADEVAERTGLESKYVRNRVLLRRLPESLMAALEAGKVQVKACEHVAKVPGAEDREALAVRVLRPESSEHPLTAEETLEIIRDEYVMPLENVIFGPMTELHGFPVCAGCPHRIIKQRTGAWCSNVACLREKAVAEFVRGEGRGSADDVRVYTDIESAWTGPGGSLAADARYLDTAAPVPPRELGHYDEVPWWVYLDEKVPGWRDEIKTFRVLHPRTGVVHVVVDKGALKLLIKSRAEAAPVPAESPGSAEGAEVDGTEETPMPEAPSRDRGPAPEAKAKTMEPGDLAIYRGLINSTAAIGGDVLSLPSVLRFLGHVLMVTMPAADLRRWCEACGVDISVESPAGAMTTAMEHLHPIVREAWILAGLTIRDAAHASTVTGFIDDALEACVKGKGVAA